MARASKILVVLSEGAKGVPAAWRTGAGADRFAVVRPGRLEETARDAGRIDAVFFQVDEDGRAPAPLKDLKRFSRGAPLLPFRLEPPASRPRRRNGRRSPRDTDVSVLPITPTLDASLLEAVLEREKQLSDQRQRVRRAVLEARDATARMRALTAIVRLTGRELDPHRIIDVAMERVGEFLKLRAWLFLLADPEQGLLTVERTSGEGLGAMKGKRLGIGEGVAGRAAQRRQPVILDDAGAGDASVPDLPKSMPARSVLAVPLMSRRRLFGVTLARGRQRGGHFTNREGRRLSLALEPAAGAIDNALLLQRSEELSVTDDL